MNTTLRTLLHASVGVAALLGLTLSAPASAKTREKIASIGLMVQDMSNPFFSAMDKGAKEAAAAIGAKLNTQDAQLDLAAQNTQIDAFIQQGVDLIVISAVDEAGIEPAILRAKEAGVIVIAVDTPAHGADAVIMTNAVQAGEKSCDYLFQQMGGKGEVLLVDGTVIQTIIDRINGCKTVAKKYPGIKIVGQQASKNDRASGLAVTTDMLTAHPDVTGIFGMNDPSALGAVLAVEQAGKALEETIFPGPASKTVEYNSRSGRAMVWWTSQPSGAFQIVERAQSGWVNWGTNGENECPELPVGATIRTACGPFADRWRQVADELEALPVWWDD